ncbi:MAG: hypothetical protein ACXWM1_07660 [Candidatus Binataceae bacterium]
MRAPISTTVFSIAIFALFEAANAEGAAPKQLFFEGDLVRGAQQGAPGPFCVLSNQFKRLEKVVWRIRVLDAAGQSLDDKGLKNVVVELPDGQKLNAKFDRHPPPAQGPALDHFWTAVWIIPTSYPSGSLGYKVVATDSEGHAQTWEPFKSQPSQLTVVAGEIEIKKP